MRYMHGKRSRSETVLLYCRTERKCVGISGRSTMVTMDYCATRSRRALVQIAPDFETEIYIKRFDVKPNSKS